MSRQKRRDGTWRVFIRGQVWFILYRLDNLHVEPVLVEGCFVSVCQVDEAFKILVFVTFVLDLTQQVFTILCNYSHRPLICVLNSQSLISRFNSNFGQMTALSRNSHAVDWLASLEFVSAWFQVKLLIQPLHALAFKSQPFLLGLSEGEIWNVGWLEAFFLLRFILLFSSPWLVSRILIAL